MTQQTPIVNPYVGPRTFSYGERHLFFGREREARDLLARVLSERLLLFYAQSGAGKSSLLQTRLIPQLQEEKGFVVLPIGRLSGELSAGVEQVDNIYAFNLMLSIDTGEDPARLAHVTLSDFLARLTRHTIVDSEGQECKGWVYDARLIPTLASPGGRRYALIVDQFEEIIITHPDRWTERKEFFRQLDQAMQDDPNLWVVLTLREDYVAALDPYAPLMADHLRARFYMERMGVVAALDAIRKPAELCDRPFAPCVAEELVDNLCRIQVGAARKGQGQKTALGHYVEPVHLQIVCHQLWEDLPPGGGTIRTEDVQAFGDVDQALVGFYEATLQKVSHEVGIGQSVLRAWFDTELLTPAGTRGLVYRGGEETGGLPNLAVDMLDNAYLIRPELRSGDIWYELAHDRLIKPIRRNNAEWYEVELSKLQRQAALWDRAQRPEGLLLRGEDLVEAERWAKHHSDELKEFECEFLARSQGRQKIEKRQRMLMIAVGGLFMLVLGAALFAILQAREAQRQKGAAIAALADAATAAGELTAVQLTVEAAENVAATAQARVDSLAAGTPANRETAEIQRATVAAAQAEAEQREGTAEAARLAATVQQQAAETLRDSAFQVVMTLVPAHTPTLTPTPPHISMPTSPTPTPSHTPIPTLTPTTRAAEKPTGKIAFPLYNWNSGTYDVYICNTDGSNRRQIASQASQPELSPDGKMIAWRSLNPSRLGIVVMNLDRNDVFNVTNYQEDERPSFASDQSLVFFSERESDRKRRLYVVGAWRGAPEKKLMHAAGEFFGETPSWLGTTQIVYKQRDPPSGIFLTDRNGRQSKLLVAGDDKMAPEGSPDGRFIAYTALSGSNWDIYVMNADGTNPRRLTSWTATDVLPTWSPDSAYIGFISDWCGTWAVWAIRPDGTGRQWLFRMRDTTADVRGNIAVWDSAGWKEGQISWSR